MDDIAGMIQAALEETVQAPIPAEIGVGSLLDETYLIEERIGRGGMGDVFRATDVKLRRTVAVKTIRPDLLREASFRKRFLSEARTMAQVDHMNVVKVHRCEVRMDGPSYLVMDFIEGETLASVLEERKTLPLKEAVDIVRQMLLALWAMHTAKIVHRDLKPSNVMLTPKGGKYHVRICDFGLGKFLEKDRADASETLTEVGRVVGTPRYMAPEQCRGDKVGERTDLYAVGIILYEMLGGKTPFGGGNHSVMMKHLVEAPRMDLLDRNVSVALRSVIQKALSKQPELRQVNAKEMIRELNLATYPRTQKRKPRLLVPVMAVLAMLVATAGAYVHQYGVPGSRSVEPKVVRAVADRAESKPTKAVVTVGSQESVPVAAKPTLVGGEEKGSAVPYLKAVQATGNVPTWSDDPATLLGLAQRYGDQGRENLRIRSLKRFLSACEKASSPACSRANTSFARIRTRGK